MVDRTENIGTRELARGQRGMTLIEIMVVIAIIGIVAGAVGYGVTRYFGQAKIDAAKAQLENIANHLEMYLYEHDEYPSNLDVLTKKEKGKGKAILKTSQLKDPWKKKLKYSVQSEGFTLCSGGPDKRDGGGDDICFGEDEEGGGLEE
ncbi:MAG: type II secretion system protein GspG [Deltaproteobacteria bacterium]|nr:type II secretion system protein GspG [Deltaproteobacteria bacterium]